MVRISSFITGQTGDITNRFYEIVQQDYPSLAILNLKDVDFIAHAYGR